MITAKWLCLATLLLFCVSAFFATGKGYLGLIFRGLVSFTNTNVVKYRREKMEIVTSYNRRGKFKKVIILLSVYLIFVFNTVACMCFGTGQEKEIKHISVIHQEKDVFKENVKDNKVRNFNECDRDIVIDQVVSDDDSDDDKKNIVQKRLTFFLYKLAVDIYQQDIGCETVDNECKNSSKYSRKLLLKYIHDSDGRKG